MNAFFAGIIFGALLAGSIAIIFATRLRRKDKQERDIIDWTERAYEPPVSTRIVVNKRKFEL